MAHNDPRRWGLGTIGSPDIQDNDINNLTDNGWYYITGKPKNSPVTYGVIHVSARTKDDIVQTIFSFDDSCQSILRRSKVWGTWKPDEWFNPPMQLGVEYRTTERWKGKPVYVQYVTLGSFPAVGEKWVGYPSTLTNISELVRYSASTGANLCPYHDASNNIYNVSPARTQAMVYCSDSSGSNYTIHLTLWYTKTTD